MIETVVATCIFMAAQTYAVPPAVLMGIMEVEGGRVGQQVGNTNKSYDLGPMQINTLWIPQLAKHWNVPYRTAYRWVRDDACTNIHVAAWILKTKSDGAGSLYQGIAHYHSKTPRHGLPYRQKVINAMRRNGLVANPNTRTGTQTAYLRR
ncbi:MAG: lytic transglycosylase domain-containing protein [Pseudomonadota bacterium]